MSGAWFDEPTDKKRAGRPVGSRDSFARKRKTKNPKHICPLCGSRIDEPIILPPSLSTPPSVVNPGAPPKGSDVSFHVIPWDEMKQRQEIGVQQGQVLPELNRNDRRIRELLALICEPTLDILINLLQVGDKNQQERVGFRLLEMAGFKAPEKIIAEFLGVFGTIPIETVRKQLQERLDVGDTIEAEIVEEDKSV